MDRNQIPLLNQLFADYREVVHAIAVVEGGGTITALTMQVVAENPDEPGMMAATDEATISVAGLSYPPQMIQAIKAQLEARRDELNDQLSELGVTV